MLLEKLLGPWFPGLDSRPLPQAVDVEIYVVKREIK